MSIKALQAGSLPPGLTSWPVSNADRLGLLSTELATFHNVAASVSSYRDEIRLQSQLENLADTEADILDDASIDLVSVGESGSSSSE